MIVAGLWPDLNCAMLWTRSSFGRPASAATVELGAARPSLPWHMAHADAIDRTPCGVVFDGAKFGAGACAQAAAAAEAASPAARILAKRILMGVSKSKGAGAEDSAIAPVAQTGATQENARRSGRLIVAPPPCRWGPNLAYVDSTGSAGCADCA